jgi:hypothetical protein
VEFFHYDFALQALAKIERGHAHDLEDARKLLNGGYVKAEELNRVFLEIEPNLARYPAIDPAQFKSKLANFLGRTK